MLDGHRNCSRRFRIYIDRVFTSLIYPGYETSFLWVHYYEPESELESRNSGLRNRLGKLSARLLLLATLMARSVATHPCHRHELCENGTLNLPKQLKEAVKRKNTTTFRTYEQRRGKAFFYHITVGLFLIVCSFL